MRTLRLFADRGAAVHRGDAERAGACDRADLFDHLRGELAGRDENKRRRAALRSADPLDERDAKSECLAGAGGRRRKDVDPAEGIRQDEVLHCKRCSHAATLERADNGCAHAERGKRFLHEVHSFGRARVETRNSKRLERRNEKPISRRGKCSRVHTVAVSLLTALFVGRLTSSDNRQNELRSLRGRGQSAPQVRAAA